MSTVRREDPRSTIATAPTTTKSTLARASASSSRSTSVTRGFEEPGHLLHSPQALSGRAAQVLLDEGRVDPRVDTLEDALIPSLAGECRIRQHEGDCTLRL